MTAFATATTSPSHLGAPAAVDVLSASAPDPVRRMEELGRIILAYSEVTDRLQQSHDQLHASLLSEDVSDRPESASLVKKISGGVKRLESLVGQVLQFSREISANCVPVDLSATVDQAIEYAAQSLSDRRVRCTIDGPRPMPVK